MMLSILEPLKPKSIFTLVWAVALCALFTSKVSAQDIADSVTTDVSTTTEAPTTEAEFSEAPAAPPKEPKSEINWSISAGGALNTGNTKSWAINLGSDFKLVHEKNHQLTASGVFNFGKADLPGDTPDAGLTTTVKNLRFYSRYDYFFTDKDAIWASVTERWDQLAGFNTQFSLEAGYLRAFIRSEKQNLYGRVGYSYTHEAFTAGGTQDIQGLLGALDYDNKLNDNVQFLSGITTVVNLNSLPGGIDPFKDVRVHFHAGLLAKLMEKLSAELRFNLLYDRIPAAAKKTDTTTTISLIYTLM